MLIKSLQQALKNEIKHRETVWARVHWELIMPMVKIRTLRARLVSICKNDLRLALSSSYV